MGGAVHDGGVDDLPLTVGAGVLEGGEDADDEVERAARVVADQVGGDHGRLVRLADHGQGAGEREVGDVVSGALGERPVLAPAGHPAVDELRIAGEAGLGPDAEAFGDAGAVALDQDVRAFDEVQDAGRTLVALEVQENGALVAVGEVGRGIDAEPRATGPVDAYDVRPEVRQQHRGERSGPDARQLDDTDTGQRTVPGPWAFRHL